METSVKFSDTRRVERASGKCVDNGRMNSDDISRLTLAHYERTADAFLAGTIDHDVSQNIESLLHAIEALRGRATGDGDGS